MTKVAVVTGSSSGIGFETSLLLAKNHFKTYATMRNLNKSHVFDTVLKEEIPLSVVQLTINSLSCTVDWAISRTDGYTYEQFVNSTTFIYAYLINI